MTACVKNHSKRVALAISASLVGALTLGAAAPAVAFAEGAEPLFAPGDFEDGTEFAQGDVNLTFKPAFRPGSIVTDVDAKGVTTVTADQIPFTVTTSQVTLAGNNEPISVVPGTDFRVGLYKADENGDPTGTALSGNRVTEAGDYVLTVTPLDGSEYTGQTFKKLFKVVPADIAADTAYEHGDITDKCFQYTGDELDISFANGSTELVEGVDYTVRYTKVKDYDASGRLVAADGAKSDKITDAGVYDAVLTGIGKYEGTTVVEDIEVHPFDLKAVLATDTSFVVVNPFQQELPEHPDRVFWDTTGTDQDVDLDTSLVNLKFADDVDVDGTMPSGPYKVLVTVDDAAVASGNVLYDNNTPTAISVVKYDEEVEFLYNGQPLQDSYDIFPNQQFNVNSVAASYNGTNLGYVELTGPRSSDPSAQPPASTSSPSPYNLQGDKVTGTGTPVDGKVIAGTKTVTVHVWAGSIDADTGLWVYGPDSDTVAIQSYEKAYDGMPLTAAMFHVGNKDNTVSTDSGMGLTAKLYKADGTEISSAVDAGEYYLEGHERLVQAVGHRPPAHHDREGRPLDARGRKARQVERHRRSRVPAQGLHGELAGRPALLVLTTTSSPSGASDSPTTPATPAPPTERTATPPMTSRGRTLIPANVDVTVERNDDGTWKPVAVIREAGQYRVTVTVGSDVASNYVLPDGQNSVTVEFPVEKNSYFSDVQPGSWYFESVNDAARLGYVKGISGTDFFAPERDITRADATVIIARMAGWDSVLSGMSEGRVQGARGHLRRRLRDVDENAYYARAVAWAAKAGIVHGDKGAFRPDDSITREEFAAMLSNYAKLIGEDISVDADEALEGANGAETVSGWARDAVAWAYENGVMGNNGSSLDGQGNITRAQTASMCVNYQGQNLPERPAL